MPRRSNRLAQKPAKDYRAMAGIKSRRAPTRKAPLVKLIKKVVSGQAESKVVAFYQTYNNGTSTARASGAFAGRGWALQNNQITTRATPVLNNLDLLQLIPYVVQGTEDNQRIGQVVMPKSLIVNGCVRVCLTNLSAFKPTDIKVCIYVLQHVQLKDYNNLYNNNDFTQLLETEENATTNFGGQSWNLNQRVSKQYYRVLKKKIITLRYAGVPTTPPVGSISNWHNYFANYRFSLAKSLPKKLTYPETGATVNILNLPTNSAPFMCMGYVNEQETSIGGTPSVAVDLEQTYTSIMTFKDL